MGSAPAKIAAGIAQAGKPERGKNRPESPAVVVAPVVLAVIIVKAANPAKVITGAQTRATVAGAADREIRALNQPVT